MAIDVSGLSFFMPILGFLFIFIVVYGLLFKTQVLGDSKGIQLFISFIMGVIFISFSSMRLYVETIIPWFAVLLVVLFLVLFVAMFSTKAWEKMLTPAFAWVVVGVLILIFLIAAIKVFNPVFHPDLIVTSGSGGESLWEQISDFFSGSRVGGSVLLIIVAVIVSWVLVKGVKG